MSDWNHIPPEIKQLVVKKLDFMGRLAMKSVSHTDRCIVNSTVFHLPRVRFGFKNDKCLIVIYQGIEKFLRLEFIKGTKGVTVIRSENTWDPKETSSKILKSSDPLESGLSILKTLFAHKSMSIEVLEWDVHVEIHNNPPLRNQILGFFYDAKLQVKQIASPTKSVGMLKDLANNICVTEKVNTFRGYGYLVSDKNLVPIMAVETYEEDGKHIYYTHYKMEQLTHGTFIEIMEALPEILYLPMGDTRQAMVSAKFFKLSDLANHDVRDHDQSFELFFKRTECGAWFNAMKTESLERFAFVKPFRVLLVDNQTISFIPDKLIADGQSGTFDFAFIDADKVNYSNYYDRSVTLLRKGGVIFVDNSLRSGSVCNPERRAEDESTRAIHETNDKIFHDDRTYSALLNLGDGTHVAFK